MKVGFLAGSVVSRHVWWFSGWFGGFLTVLVVFWLSRRFAGCFGGFLPLWGPCVAISPIAWPLRPLAGHFGSFLGPLAPSLPPPGQFCQFLAISVLLGGCLASAQSKTASIKLTFTPPPTHLLWDPGHTQGTRGGTQGTRGGTQGTRGGAQGTRGGAR